MYRFLGEVIGKPVSSHISVLHSDQVPSGTDTFPVLVDTVILVFDGKFSVQFIEFQTVPAAPESKTDDVIFPCWLYRKVAYPIRRSTPSVPVYHIL